MKSSAQLISIISLILAVTSLAGCSLLPADSPDAAAKDFSADGLVITLNENFVKQDAENLNGYYVSRKSSVAIIKEDFAKIEALTEDDDITPSDYAELVKKNNAIEADVTVDGDIASFIFEKKVNGKDYTYYACCYRGSDAFWLVEFFSAKEDHESLLESFKLWSRSVKFN